VRTLWRFRGLLWSFTLRELQVRYRQAALGFAWALLQPTALTLVTTLVVHRFLHVTVSGSSYPLFAYTGLLVWSFFHTAVSGAVPSLVNNASLVRKIWFPRETLPLGTVAAVGLDLLAALLLWLALLAFEGLPWSVSLLWVLPLLGILLAFSAACALFGAAVNVRWRDVKHALPLLLQLLFFATPIVYPASLIPAPWRALSALNPLASVVGGLREIAFEGHGPDALRTLGGAAVALSSLLLAWSYFIRVDRGFADTI